LSRGELAGIKYINYSYWVELSGGSRLVGDGAERVASGSQAFGVPNQGFWDVAERIVRGEVLPEPILFAVGVELVILEGHVRLTAYVLAGEVCPQEITAIVGFEETAAASESNLRTMPIAG